ncbi:hypothetical protein A0H81_08564 [Grifola frondosa]|uniref:Uncharacterized protein n=1 Tax=Grifola frondosa TaxID=5627 RepID=A0A1C7M2Q2_GRIFR|nr:hypothetical protein A0H81_08564 [Grifola frondosa]
MVKESLLDGAVNGLVSDAAHGFWLERNSLLIVTSCYAPSLNRWIPGLFTYSNGASALHFEHHFYALFESIAKEASNRGLEVSDTMFSDVMDFSEAERGGFIAAFTRFWRVRSDDVRSDDELAEAATKLLKGCRQHFRAGVTRVKSISGVVSPSDVSAFQRHAEALLNAPDIDTFKECANTLLAAFPKVKPWLSWWLRDAHASMLFDSQRKMEPEIWDSIPETTNAEEAMHWTLHCTRSSNIIIDYWLAVELEFAFVMGQQSHGN